MFDIFSQTLFNFVVQLYEPLGVVLFVTPLFSMRKSFYTVSIVNTQLVISLCACSFRSYPTCQV